MAEISAQVRIFNFKPQSSHPAISFVFHLIRDPKNEFLLIEVRTPFTHLYALACTNECSEDKINKS